MWTLKWPQGKPCECDRMEELKTFEEAGREKRLTCRKRETRRARKLRRIDSRVRSK